MNFIKIQYKVVHIYGVRNEVSVLRLSINSVEALNFIESNMRFHLVD